ncbi:hypothetical protein [Noviherbaspirillum aridicola]|uniref:hypothetical protein n=1 Tax=Noviherbaspirillum aridicola TaxID=2849687 RepID=UPI001C805113|nr:hypothetical protein [Noviherbaspirillum aridicola]
MRHALTGKCSSCGRKNDWNDSECPGCHVRLRPWMPFVTVFATVMLAIGAMVASS